MPVTVTVEDGTGVTAANSYISLADWKIYATQHGWDHSAYTDEQIKAALIRATSAIDALYETRFDGVRTYEDDQELAWPRKAGTIYQGVFTASTPTTLYTSAGLEIAIDEVPAAVVSATAEAAWRELREPGVFAPDLDRGGGIRRFKAGSVEVEYSGAASAWTTFSIIDRLLAGLLLTSSAPTWMASSVRG